MSISHRTNRLKLLGTPAVEQLQNGRYQLTINCTTMNRREDWYSANKSRIFPDFGSLQSAKMSIDGLGTRTGEDYDDMRLISVQSSTQGDEYVVTLVYATISSSFVQIKDDTINLIENNLRRVTRTSIARAGTTFSKTIGTSSITSDSVACVLANFEINDTDSYREVTEVYIEKGTLSESIEEVGSQKAIVKETIGDDPSTPTGYSIASKEESNFSGYQTNRFRFLKNNVVLSESEDKVGSQLAIVKEVFNGTASTPSGYVLADEQTSNVDGIPTKRFRFLKENAELSTSQDRVGSQLAIVKEVFKGTPSTPGGYSVAAEQESEVDGLPTKRFTFLKDNTILSKSEDKVGSQKAIVLEVFNGTPVTPGSDYSIAAEQESNVAGIPTKRFTFLSKGVLSRSISTRNNGKLIIETVEVFNDDPTADTANAIQIGNEVSDVLGIPTRRFTFAAGEGQLRTATRPGRIPGTTEFTVVSYGEEVVPDGKLIYKSESQEDGYIKFINTAIQGTIEGVKQEYKDVVQVEVPGEVNCTTISVASGGESGTIAVPQVTPRRKKTIQAQVTVEIKTTPTNTASVAYDLGAISCSVTSTNVALTEGAGNTASAVSGAVVSTLTGFVKNFSASARIQTYPGCFLTNASSNGSIDFQSAQTPRANANVIVFDESFSSRETSCTGTGSTSQEGYSTTGIIKRNSRPIITSLDGTQYYEVITWSVGDSGEGDSGGGG